MRGNRQGVGAVEQQGGIAALGDAVTALAVPAGVTDGGAVESELKVVVGIGLGVGSADNGQLDRGGTGGGIGTGDAERTAATPAAAGKEVGPYPEVAGLLEDLRRGGTPRPTP